MKKLAIFAAAFVLTLGLAQCKKEQPNAQNIEGETVHITVNVGASAGSATNGSRADIQNPSTGHYDFKDGDKLYVGYNGVCAGALNYSASASIFSGDITISQSGSQRLHFYYLGGSLEPAIDGTEYTVDISNQSENYPVISYGTSNKDYDGAGTYRTTLLNKCALVKFTLVSGTTDAVAVGGMMTKATIDFANPGVVTPSAAGEITLHTEASNTTEKWAILLAQDAVDDALVAVGYYGYTVDIPKIEDNAIAPQFDAINNSEPSNLIVLNGLTNDYTATNGQVLTGTLANNVKISIAAGATVTLDGVTINGVNNSNYAWAGLNCVGNATIILKDGSENTVKGFNQNYPGIHVPDEDYTLTINGTGSLTASSNGNGAGIGGGLGISCGNILIKGGVINATGGYGAAGIGGALYGQCGNITISGGTVTATGGEEAAGIGGATSCGTITISGGTIEATGGGRAAGIGSGAGGGGNQGSSCGAITISDGNVTANGGLGASGIGSGLNGSCGAITITGGTVSATGGDDAAGIGSGYEASCGYITITNGVTQVTATKGADHEEVGFGFDNYYSIGAGAGEYSTCGTVTIGCTLDGDGNPEGGQTGPVITSPYTYKP